MDELLKIIIFWVYCKCLCLISFSLFLLSLVVILLVSPKDIFGKPSNNGLKQHVTYDKLCSSLHDELDVVCIPLPQFSADTMITINSLTTKVNVFMLKKIIKNEYPNGLLPIFEGEAQWSYVMRLSVYYPEHSLVKLWSNRNRTFGAFAPGPTNLTVSRLLTELFLNKSEFNFEEELLAQIGRLNIISSLIIINILTRSLNTCVDDQDLTDIYQSWWVKRDVLLSQRHVKRINNRQNKFSTHEVPLC